MRIKKKKKKKEKEKDKKTLDRSTSSFYKLFFAFMTKIKSVCVGVNGVKKKNDPKGPLI